jgi:hypothetical protein
MEPSNPRPAMPMDTMMTELAYFIRGFACKCLETLGRRGALRNESDPGIQGRVSAKQVPTVRGSRARFSTMANGRVYFLQYVLRCRRRIDPEHKIGRHLCICIQLQCMFDTMNSAFRRDRCDEHACVIVPRCKPRHQFP